jgi:hypothetical protein
VKRYCRIMWLVSCVLLFVTVVPLLAHHSAASMYDPAKKVTLKGTVTKVVWINPHIGVYFDAPDPAQGGKVVNWELGDGQSPNGLYRMGWRKDDLKPGDQITIIDCTLARDGSNKVGGGIITLANGQKVYTGTKGDGL